MIRKAVLLLSLVTLLGHNLVHSAPTPEDEQAYIAKRFKRQAGDENAGYIARRFKRSTATCTEPFKRLPASTMCKYTPDPTATDLGVSWDEIRQIVDLHNQYRAAATPTPSDMQKLYWDPALADIAQYYASTCRRTQHDGNNERWVPGYGISVGQNLCVGYANWKACVDGWHGEVKNYIFGADTDAMVGHYTQMMMKASSSIGCGFARCSYGTQMICNYAFGQTLDMKKHPYTDAGKCSKCPKTCDADGLCDCKGWICMNGGTIDPDTCSCSCKPGYSGSACHIFTCPNKDPYQCSGYAAMASATELCKNAQIYTECPIMCGQCNEKCPSLSASMCKNGGTLNFDTCKCECTTGWTGTTCEDKVVNCVADQSYCPSFTAMCFDDYIKTVCPYACNICGEGGISAQTKNTVK